MKRLVLLALILALAPLALAEPQHISVLSVTEGNVSSGGVADIFLEVRPGSGAVYIDSFPLTKLDTQLSARFAREYACRLSGRDCSSLDFFFVIRSHSTIIGGPSAGGAMTVLAYAVLEDLEVREDTTMTGTINSGGLIGPVGGVDAKVGAAVAEGFSRVLVPAPEYRPSSSPAVEVVPVSDVEEAIWYFTGEDVRGTAPELVVPVEYTKTMEQVSEELCSRARELSERSTPESLTQDLLVRGERAAAEQRYYSAASFCFSASLDLREQLFENRSQEDLRGVYRQLESDIAVADASLPDDFSSLADLEVFMIVRERLLESHDVLSDEEYTNLSAEGLAYALERYHSAIAWSAFFGAIPSERLDIDEDLLAGSCRSTLAEAEERINYIVYLTRQPLPDTSRELENAYEYHRQGEWALCVFSATKAKAEADSVISVLYAGEDVNASVERKLIKARDVLARSVAEGQFPILSYSYYEYAQDLDDVYSANLYGEYALGLGSLELYFPPRGGGVEVDPQRLFILLAGVVLGFAGGILTHDAFTRRRRKR